MIKSVREIWRGATTSVAADGPREYTRIFQVLTDRPDHKPQDILKHRRIPQLFESRYPGDRDAVCHQLSATRADASRLVWTVNADYSTDADPEANPLRRPAKISFRAETAKKVITKDLDGRAITNVVGDYLDGVEVEESRWVLEVRKNVPRKLPRWILEYNNAINKDEPEIRGLKFPKYTLMLKGIRIPAEVKRGGKNGEIEYIEISFELHYNPNGWRVRVANRGTRGLVVRKLARDQADKNDDVVVKLPSKKDSADVWAVVRAPIEVGSPPQPVREPVWLDDQGFPIQSLETVEAEELDLDHSVDLREVVRRIGKDFQPRPQAKPFFLTFKAYKELEFSKLPL